MTTSHSLTARNPDIEAAISYALGRLAADLLSLYTYHGVAHTRDEVLPAAEQLAAVSGVSGRELGWLRVAAAFHDIGFLHRAQGHELGSIRVVAQVLPGFDFGNEAIEDIMGMILATRLPQTPRNHLEELMADADLAMLGANNFLERNAALREEMARQGQDVLGRAWYVSQLGFMRNHRYFTEAAKRLYGPGKAQNLRLLEACLLAEETC